MICWLLTLREMVRCLMYIYAGREYEASESALAFEYDLRGYATVQTISTPPRYLFAANEPIDEGIWDYA